ncbi:MAG: SCO family protein [Thioalkalivibrio sp.]|nr:SCO family protein [Thioalkalivibrio sp.]
MSSQPLQMPCGRVLLVLVTLLAIGALSLSGWWLNTGHGGPNVDETVLKPMPRPVTLPEARLRTAAGEPFGRAAFKGQWTLLYFGYTFCPDVCPVELGALREVRRLLDEQAPGLSAQTRTVFVSIDPERDSPERIRTFTEYFDPRIIGVTGDPVELRLLAEPLGVGWSKRASRYAGSSDREGASGDYLVDHTTVILLVDPQARLQAVFPTPHQPRAMVNAYRKFHRYYEETRP